MGLLSPQKTRAQSVNGWVTKIGQTLTSPVRAAAERPTLWIEICTKCSFQQHCSSGSTFSSWLTGGERDVKAPAAEATYDLLCDHLCFCIESLTWSPTEQPGASENQSLFKSSQLWQYRILYCVKKALIIAAGGVSESKCERETKKPNTDAQGKAADSQIGYKASGDIKAADCQTACQTQRLHLSSCSFPSITAQSVHRTPEYCSEKELSNSFWWVGIKEAS